MHIREAAEQSGVNATTIRYYEEVGLLRGVRRTESGYRVFDGQEVRILIFIRKARDLGFSIEACHELLVLVTKADPTDPGNVKRKRAVAEQRLHEIEEQIETLSRMRDLVHWHIGELGANSSECPVAGNLHL